MKTSSEITGSPCSLARSAKAIASEFLRNEPVGLFGLTVTMARVLSEMCSRKFAKSMNQLPSYKRRYGTERTPSKEAKYSNNGYDGTGTSTSPSTSQNSLNNDAYASLVLAVIRICDGEISMSRRLWYSAIAILADSLPVGSGSYAKLSIRP